MTPTTPPVSPPPAWAEEQAREIANNAYLDYPPGFRILPLTASIAAALASAFAAGRRAGLEEAAGIAGSLFADHFPHSVKKQGGAEVAKAIRALLPTDEDSTL